MKLLKNGRVGKICKLAALVIALIGTAQVLLQFYAIWAVYRETRAQPAQFSSSLTIVYSALPNLSSTLQSVATTIFYVVVLYSAGNIINAFFGPAHDETGTNNIDETAITYGPLDDGMIIESLDKRR